MGDFVITADAHYMSVITSGGDVDIFDLADNRKIHTISTGSLFGNPSDSLAVCGNDRLVIYSKSQSDVAVIRFSDGRLLWHQQFKSLTSGRTITALEKGEKTGLLILNYDEIMTVSAENGEILSSYIISDVSGGEASAVYSSDFSVCVDSENDGYSILCMSSGDDSDKSTVTGVLTCYYETDRTVWTPFSREYYW